MNTKETTRSAVRLYRFGPYELDLERHELRKFGVRLKLAPKPFQLLIALLDDSGNLVTRSELRQLLWGDSVFVDFEKGLTVVATKLRAVLNDSPENPKYIATIAGEGYQFIAAVEKFTSRSATHNAQENGRGSSDHGVSTPSSFSALGSGFTRARWLGHRWLWAGAAVFSVAVAVTFFTIRHFSSQTKPALNFQARDWVLITNLDNRTGDAVFSGTLEYALERELSNSQFVNVVPRERIDDALRLMRKPLDSKIDPALGREICLRDGGIQILLTGRIENIGTTYVLTVGLVDTARGATVASISEEEPADSRMAGAVRRLSDRVRETLGEERSLIQQSDQRLEKVTTPSLHALQLYTQADDAIRLHSFDVAAEMLELALQEDPNFASAQLLLGFAYADAGNDPKSAPYFERAFELADTVTDRERFFILGSYYEAVGHNPQKVVDAYETLLQLYPDHFWGTHNLSGWYESMGRTEDAARLLVRQAELAPNDLRSNAEAVWAKAILDQDWKGAQKYRDRANALLAQQGHSADAFMAFMPIWIKLLPVYESWLQGNLQRSHAQLIQLEASGNLEGVEAGYAHLAFGELRRAEECFRVDSDRDWFAGAEGVLLFIRGDWSALKRFLPNERRIAYPGSTASVFMARAGMWSDVERALREAGQEWGPPYRSEITEGELALARGDIKDGISLLEQGLIARRWWPDASFFLGSNSLAGAYEKQGRLDEALRVLQRASREKGQTVPDPSKGPGDFASMWMTSELELADLYRKMGRLSDAEKVEEALSKLLIYADPDHPILVALRNRSHTPAVLATN